MPSIKRRKAAKRSIQTGLTIHQIAHLFIGFSMEDDFDNDEHRKKCWFDNRQYLLDLAHEFEGRHDLAQSFGVATLAKAPDPGELPKAFYEYEKGGVFPEGECEDYIKMWGKK